VDKKILVSVVIVTWNRKEQVLKCVESVLKSVGVKLELIIVDNGSTDGTSELISKHYPKAKLVLNKKNLFVSKARNLGASFAKGKYIVFIDSDNVIDKNMIFQLAKVALKDKKAGLLGPKMYYLEKPEIIWYAGADINLITSKTTYTGLGEKDLGQFDKVVEVGHIPNVFMVEKNLFKNIAGFDEKNFPMHYEESDFAERVREKGFKVLFIPKAITYHDTPFKSKESQGVGLALNDPDRVYHNLKHRIIFMKKYGKNYPVFVLFFLPFFSFYYLITLARVKRFDLIGQVFRGVKDSLLEKI